MKTPKIELKKVKSFIGREGYGLNAELYVDGVKTAFCRDDASGGGMDFDIFNKESFKKIEDYAKSLPETPIDFGDGPVKDKDNKVMMIGSDVESLVNAEFDRLEKEKASKKVAKKFDNHLIWGVPGANNYTQVKFPVSLSKVPTEILQKSVDKHRASFGKGVEFWNTNLKTLNIK